MMGQEETRLTTSEDRPRRILIPWSSNGLKLVSVVWDEQATDGIVQSELKITEDKNLLRILISSVGDLTARVEI